MARGDRTLGIVLGIVLGIAIVAIFVFVFSEDTIDSAGLENGSGPEAPRSAPANP
ncbi:MAG: hypothetical protein M3383_03820 [Actinomycetota bacterium]|nr:hypothetical protein [Actinomycetota bacterium]